MRGQPSVELIKLLERLDLASPDQANRMHRRAARLARELPLFDSVWIDALAQARILSPFQAAQINAGRGNSLAAGPYVLSRSLGSTGYADWFQARRRGSGELARVGVAYPPRQRAADVLAALKDLACKSRQFDTASLLPVCEADADDDRVWFAGPDRLGKTAGEWMVSNGRFPPEAVLEIARQMVHALHVLENRGLWHGDISTSDILLTRLGDVTLLQPGVRPILRPEEGFTNADLPPEAYDYLAPERVTNASSPTSASEIYSCGAVWWHLLAGRPPLPGGDSLSKLQAAQVVGIPDVRSVAPDTPALLAAAIAAAVCRDPKSRPESFSQLATWLGPPTRTGRSLVARCLMSRPIDPLAWLAPARAVRHWERAALWVCLTAGCITAALAIGWSFWQAGLSKGLQPKASATASAARGTKPQLLCAAEAATAMNNAAGEGAGSGQAGVLLTKHEEEVAERRANAPDSGGALAILDRQGVHPVPQEALLDRQQVHPVLQETLVLPSDGPVSIDAEQIRPGQTIRGEEGKRPMIVVPRGGLRLDAENVRFEEIDFVWDGSDASSGQQAAIVRLQASCVAFQRCSFQSARPDVSLPAAIVWSYPVDPSEAERSLPSGEVSMSHCVLRNVAAGIVCRTHATLAVTLENTLYLGRGPMLALSRYPRVDEGLVIRMTHTTLRASGPLVHCPCGSETRVGTLSIVADGCVFAPSGQTSLLTFSGPQSPEELLKHLTWSGQGSLIPPSTAVASWQEIDGRIHLLDDSALAIAGLVRSEVEFAGPPEANPAASRAVGWQAPLQSPNPPGIVPEHVAGPNR